MLQNDTKVRVTFFHNYIRFFAEKENFPDRQLDLKISNTEIKNFSLFFVISVGISVEIPR